MVYIGIDVGGTGIKAGIVSAEGALLQQNETPTLVGRPYPEIVADMAACARVALERGGYSDDDVAAVGIGIPGVADQNTGVVRYCPNMFWTDIPLREEMQKHFNKPVFIDNDATVAGFAESVCGVSAGCHSSVFITLGTGVGSGIVLGGRPWSGFHGVGGELGHTTMDLDGDPCNCGKFGCTERYTSATAIIRMGRQAAKEHPESALHAACGGDLERLNAKMVIDCAREGDEVASKVFKRYANDLAIAINTVVSFLDPEMIVLGGGVSRAGDFLLDAVRERVPRYLLVKSVGFARIEIAQLGAEAGMIGAAMLGRDA